MLVVLYFFLLYLNENSWLLNTKSHGFFEDEKDLCHPGKSDNGTGKVLYLLFLCVYIPCMWLPHQVFSVLPFEFHTGATTGIHTTTRPKVMTATSTKWSYKLLPRETHHSLFYTTISYFHTLNLIAIPTHYIISVYFPCNLSWLTHAVMCLDVP